MTDNQQLNQLQASQTRAVELARHDLAKLWETLQQLSPEWQRDMLLDYVPQLVAKYGDLAAQAAYEWYMRVRIGARTMGVRPIRLVPRRRHRQDHTLAGRPPVD